MKPLVTRFLALSSDLNDPVSLHEWVHGFYHALVGQLAPHEFDPLCRQLGELIILEAAVNDNGFRSYIDRYDWRPQAADDLIAAFAVIGASEHAQTMSAIARRLNALPAKDMRALVYRRTERHGAEDPLLRELNDWLDEHVGCLWVDLSEKAAAALHRLRQARLIKGVASEWQFHAELDRILAKSPTHQAHERAVEAWREANRPLNERRGQVISQLGRLARVSVDHLSYRQSVRNEIAWAPLCWILSVRKSDGSPDPLGQRVCYFEDGDMGVLARLSDGVHLAAISIEPGSTGYVPWPLKRSWEE